MVLNYVNKKIKFSDSVYDENGNVVLSEKDMKFITFSKSITIKDIIEHPEFKWDWKNVSCIKDITPELMKEHNLPFYWEIFCCNRNLTIKLVLENADNQSLVWRNISNNSSITISDINNNLHLPWDWHWISEREDLTDNDVESHFDLPWEYHEFIDSGVSFEFIVKHEKRFQLGDCSYLKIEKMSRNPNLCIDDVDKIVGSDKRVYSYFYPHLFANDRRNYVEFHTKNILCVYMLDYLYNAENYEKGEFVPTDVDLVLGNAENYEKGEIVLTDVDLVLGNAENYEKGEIVPTNVDLVLGNDYILSKILSY